MILACGGAGQLFERNLNPSDITGDGYALALRAGAELINMVEKICASQRTEYCDRHPLPERHPGFCLNQPQAGLHKLSGGENEGFDDDKEEGVW